MVSVLGEIKKLRGDKSIVIDPNNDNRYRVVLKEPDGSQTAYYFSTAIYNNKTNKAVDLKFHQKDDAVCFTGSNANITFSNQIKMENAEGCCRVFLDNPVSFASNSELLCGNNHIYPTTNGFMYKMLCKGNNAVSFELEIDKFFMNVRANDKYFALMSGEFRPFVVFSCIGTWDSTCQLTAPAKLEYQKLTDRKYRLTVSSASPLGNYVLFEANLYENKLFQDTTVESLNPTVNNAFGGTAFIGNTSAFGEQWLYSRLDYSRISDLMDKRVNRAVLHLPKYNKSGVELGVFKVTSRFCSFGSTWNNKIASGAAVSDSVCENGYQSVELTSLITDEKTKTIMESEGLILKSKVKGSGFSAIATSDSYYAPQILEINYT